MSYLKKIGYLRGLADGLAADMNTPEGKLISALMDVVEAMAVSIGELESAVESLEEQLDELYEEIDEFTEGLEEITAGLALGDSDDSSDNISVFSRPGEEDDEENEIYQLTCPACEKEIFLMEDELLKGSVTCPGCGEQLEIDVGCHGCGCGCEDEDDEEE